MAEPATARSATDHTATSLGAARLVDQWTDASLRSAAPGRRAQIDPVEYLAHRLLEASRAMGDPARGLVWLDAGGPAAGDTAESVLTAFPWCVVRRGEADVQTLADFIDTLDEPHAGPAPDPDAPLPRFRGGWLGWFAYEAVEGLEPVRLSAQRDLAMPVASWALHPTWFRLLPAQGRLELWTRLRDDVTARPDGRPLPALSAWRHWAADAVRARTDHTMPMWAPPAALPTGPAASAQAAEDMARRARRSFDQAAFEAAVATVQQAILEGEVFQANLAHRLTLVSDVDPFVVYLWLRRLNPSPFALYLEEDTGTIVSNSPERLVQVRDGPDGRVVEMRPIAGTRPRGADAATDAAHIAALLGSAKERAEHTMLVDLARNDVGRICTPGSVQVRAFQTVEAYSHVHHLVSRVEGRLPDDARWSDVLRATFPGGTITGAPKLRSIEVIDRVEPVQRGPYTGSAGYIDPDGTGDLDILIRTLVHREGRYHVYAGAGIVADSDPAAEYEETLHKAAAMLLALASADPHATGAAMEAST